MGEWAGGAIAKSPEARLHNGMDDTPSLMRSSLLGTPREWAKDLAAATIIGVFLGVIGPFGSFYGGRIELRLVYWVADVWMGLIVLATVTRLAIRIAGRLDVPVWFALATGIALGSFPLGAMIALFSAWFWPGNHGHISPFFIWYGQTLAIAEPCTFAYYFIGRRVGLYPDRPDVAAPDRPGPASPPASTEEASEGLGAPLLDRLPPRLGRNLLCLQMEDHYVRVHTDRGSELVLMPLKAAMAEVQGIDGMQVHRSWWVARAAVVETVQQGRNLGLRLSNGIQAPVSRSFVAALRANRWLDSRFSV